MRSGTRILRPPVFVLLLASASPLAFAAEPAPEYRPDAEIAVKGVVASVVRHAGWMGWDGVYGTLRAKDGDVLQVHFAPAAFLEMLELVPAPGDVLEIRGAMAETPGGPILLVRELRRANVVIHLRDAGGRPVW